MPTVYDASDLSFTWDADYLLDEGGDLKDTWADQIQSLVQEIMTISNSDTGDWQDFPDRAAALNDFVGEPNNRTTGQRLVERLRSALINNNIVRADDLQIRVVPTGRHEVLIVVSVAAAATQANSLQPNGPAIVTLLYDYMEQGVFLVDANQFYNREGIF